MECFIDETMERPSRDSSELTDWVMMNFLIIKWFFNTFDTSIIGSVPYMADAKDLWVHLKKMFFARNGPRIYRLEEAVGNCYRMLHLFFITMGNSLTCGRG